jgi:hypothetical protein
MRIKVILSAGRRPKTGDRRRLLAALLLTCVLSTLGGCFAWRSSDGGGETAFTPPRQVSPSDIAVPQGYHIEAVATVLTFPTGVTFDEEGNVYVVESGYSYGEVWDVPRLIRVSASGQTTVVAEGENNGPWTGAFFFDGAIYIAEGGSLRGGRILRATPQGAVSVVVDPLPSMGDHHTNGPVSDRMGICISASERSLTPALPVKTMLSSGGLRGFHIATTFLVMMSCSPVKILRLPTIRIRRKE